MKFTEWYPIQNKTRSINSLIPVLVVVCLIMTGCSDSPTDSGNDNDLPDGDVVEMVGHSFSPAEIEVTVGTTVTWVNESNEAHTVTSGSGGNHDGIFDSGAVDPGDQFTFTFEETGTYDYFCIPHLEAGMTGTVTVVE